MQKDPPRPADATQLIVAIPTVENASPELTSGQGYSFEDAVATTYLAALLGESGAPGVSEATVVRVALQQGAFGHPLDDLVVTVRRPDGTEARFDAQVKRALTISAAKTNPDFRDTILRAHQTVSNPGFRLLMDRVGAITGDIALASKRDFETLCEMARAQSDAVVFAANMRTPGTMGNKLAQFEAVRAILAPHVQAAELDAAAHRLLSHFILLFFDMLAEGSIQESQTIAQLASCLPDAHRAEAGKLWRSLNSLVRTFQGRAAGLDRRTLVASLKGSFRLRGAPSFTAALAALRREAERACLEVSNQIGGVTVSRVSFADRVKAKLRPGAFVQIVGAPGAGKSVVLRSLVEQALAAGTAIFLKSDRLAGSTWAQYAQQTGLGDVDLETLLVELAATGGSTLYIDGIDRVEVSQRKVILDVLNQLQSSPHLENWSIVASVRDTGIEHIRTWLPDVSLKSGVSQVEVVQFSDEDAKVLADALPALAASLFGPEPLRSLVRRPFFASILAKEARKSSSFPASEVGLAGLWWKGGGYGAEASRAGQRQNALVAMAREGAVHLGRQIPVRNIDAVALADLAADGIVSDVRVGHTVRFAHDIFFEWAFLQYLVGEAGHWPAAVQRAGEPPALGRVVELLSQVELVDGDQWAAYLARLEADSSLRSQWRRSWLVGPFSLPFFDSYRAEFDAAVFVDVGMRAQKLLVWFQAEKTTPNPRFLNNADFDPALRIRVADRYAIPSVALDWQRFCNWLLDGVPRIPATALLNAFEALNVWQNLCADRPNPTSRRIVDCALSLLKDLEQRRRWDDVSESNARWEVLGSDERDTLEKLLRAILLRDGRAQSKVVSGYLAHLKAVEHLPSSATRQVLDYSVVLADFLSVELVDYTLHAFVGQLPVASQRERQADQDHFSYGMDSWVWDNLGINDEQEFNPPAPTREPFQALFKAAPEEARRLVRELANHATKAWRQAHRLSRHDRRGTPIPLVLEFPWGKQTFWGARQQYEWAIGQWAPDIVSSGLMALGEWAFAELERGQGADDVIRLVVEGHRSVGVLHLACVIALKARAVSPTTLPLFTSQRVWHWEFARQNAAMVGLSANQGGFHGGEESHQVAVRVINERERTVGHIRDLALLCHVMGGELAAKSSEAIRRFEEDVAVDRVEDRQDAELMTDHRRNAEIWAQFGVTENYRAQAAPDGKGYHVTVENPKAVGPDIDAAQAQRDGLLSTVSLQVWNDKYFKSGIVPDSMTLSQAVVAAKALELPDLFEQGFSIRDWRQAAQGVVAGVAAVVLQEGVEDELDWAASICGRALKTPSSPDDFFIPSSFLSNHPVQNAVRGVGGLLKLSVDDDQAREFQAVLVNYTAHPYEQIGLTALRELVQAWAEHPDIAWDTLRLAVELSLIDVQARRSGGDMETEQARREQKAQAEVDRLFAPEPADRAGVAALPALPPHWVRASDDGIPRGTNRRGRTVRHSWLPSRVQVHINFLKDVLTFVPLDVALADDDRRIPFLDWCEGLASWTVQRAYPIGEEGERDGLAGDSADVSDFEWSLVLYKLLADVVQHIPAEECERRFLASAAKADDKTYCDLVGPFVTKLCCRLADEETIPAIVIPLLQTVVSRVRRVSNWPDDIDRQSREERDLSRIVESVFFSSMGTATLSKRFANGDWQDVALIFPLVDPLLQTHGHQPVVVSAWLSLCDQAFEHYPAGHFIEHLKYLFPGDGRQVAWRKPQLVAQLAGLIQRFSTREAPLQLEQTRELLRALDELVDMGDRRAAAVQMSEVFRSTRRIDV